MLREIQNTRGCSEARTKDSVISRPNHLLQRRWKAPGDSSDVQRRQVKRQLYFLLKKLAQGTDYSTYFLSASYGFVWRF